MTVSEKKSNLALNLFTIEIQELVAPSLGNGLNHGYVYSICWLSGALVLVLHSCILRLRQLAECGADMADIFNSMFVFF